MKGIGGDSGFGNSTWLPIITALVTSCRVIRFQGFQLEMMQALESEWGIEVNLFLENSLEDNVKGFTAVYLIASIR